MTRRPWVPRLSAAVLLAGAALLTAGSARAQLPDKFENLQVLPQDISRDSLLTVMRGFTAGLGVHCEFCHVENEQDPQRDTLFKVDTKDNKRKARFMLRMVEYLDQQRLPTLGAEAAASREDPPVQVTCATCHRGVPIPRPLDQVLALTAEKVGTDSAVAEYGDLRKSFYGSGSYDFGEGTLVSTADRLVQDKKLDGAERFLELNLKTFPQSVGTLLGMSRVAEARGDKGQALQLVQKAAAIQPRNRQVQAALKRLQGGGR